MWTESLSLNRYTKVLYSAPLLPLIIVWVNIVLNFHHQSVYFLWVHKNIIIIGGHWRPIADWHVLSETHRRQTCLNQRSIWDRWGMSVCDEACRSLMRHIGLQKVSDEACLPPIRHVCFRLDMSVSNGCLMDLR